MEVEVAADKRQPAKKNPIDMKTLSEHFEHLADNQNDRIEEFLLTMERMISNGQPGLVVSWPATRTEEDDETAIG